MIQKICSYKNNSLEKNVAKLFFLKKITLAIAESCTGGLLSHLLTNIAGSSKFLFMSIIAYNNFCKINNLNISSQFLKKYGAVSKQTSILMAKQIRKIAKTDLGVSTTGFAGPTTNDSKSYYPVGTVFIALSHKNGTYSKHFFFPFQKRSKIKLLAAQSVLELLKIYLLNL